MREAKTILEEFWEDFLEDFAVKSTFLFGGFSVCLAFLRAAYRATLARRAPALRAQYGGRALRASSRVNPVVTFKFIEAPLGGVPPPKVFGVGRVAIRKGVWKKKAWRFEFS